MGHHHHPHPSHQPSALTLLLCSVHEAVLNMHSVILGFWVIKPDYYELSMSNTQKKAHGGCEKAMIFRTTE